MDGVAEESAELGMDAASKPVMVMVADVERVVETAELDQDAASEPAMVLDEAEQTAVEDIPALKHFQSTESKVPDCAAQVAPDERDETANDAKKQIVEGVAEEGTES